MCHGPAKVRHCGVHAATSGDIVVFIDSDLIKPHPLACAMVGPLLTGEGIQLVNIYRRRRRSAT